MLVYFDEFGRLQHAVSFVLQSELAAYRVLNKRVVRITDEQEIAALEEAISQRGELAHVSAPLSTTLTYLTDRMKPDFRNAIKESISAVEAAAKIISGEDNATCGFYGAKNISVHSRPAARAASDAEEPRWFLHGLFA